MSDLLPPSSTQLERIAAQVGATATELPVILRSLWDPEECPLELLPWLAWAWSADEWSESWSERQKRDVVKNAIQVQSIKGTIGAVKTALGALGIEIRVQEWFNQTPPADPYTFSVHVETEQTQATQADLVKALELIAATKNLRSHLQTVFVTTRSQSLAHVAAVAHIGHDITLAGFQAAPVAINEFALNLGA
ncbi:Phage tail protein [compost metagenome]